jgi:5-methyltetrahydropteroyltriglutamate--homocysteine methyltransferase
MSLSFRADHVGSLLRPAELLDARRSHISAEEIHALEDQQILRILQRQKDLGLEIFTDGELRRTNFMSDITEAVEGFDLGGAAQLAG